MCWHLEISVDVKGNEIEKTQLFLFFNFKCNSLRNGCASPPLVDRSNVLTSDIRGLGLKVSNGKEHCVVFFCCTKILCKEFSKQLYVWALILKITTPKTMLFCTVVTVSEHTGVWKIQIFLWIQSARQEREEAQINKRTNSLVVWFCTCLNCGGGV
jgi:hypothetical protein